MRSALLQALDEAGVTLWKDGEVLRYRAPCGAITPELREAMFEARAELIVAVEARGGLLLPEARVHWPNDLRREFEAQAEKLAGQGKLSQADVERRARANAGVVWLRHRTGEGGPA